MLTTVNLTSQRYIDAARRVLDASGPRAVTMRAVAGVAGTTATAIYRHFADKDELLDVLHQQVFGEFKATVSAVPDELGVREAFLAGLETYRDFGLENPAAFEFLFIEPHGIRTSRYPQDFDRVRSSTFGLLVEGVQACMREGLIAEGDAISVALGFDAHVLGLMMLYRSGRFGDDVASFRRFFRETLEHRLTGD